MIRIYFMRLIINNYDRQNSYYKCKYFFGNLNFPLTFDFTGKNKNKWFGAWKFPAQCLVYLYLCNDRKSDEF